MHWGLVITIRYRALLEFLIDRIALLLSREIHVLGRLETFFASSQRASQVLNMAPTRFSNGIFSEISTGLGDDQAARTKNCEDRLL
jgi:hypothetical protein